MSVTPLKVLIVASEVTPYAKSGGLGDVIGSLPKELSARGVDVRIVFPKYSSIKSIYSDRAEYVDSFVVTLGWRKQSASIYKIDAGYPAYMIENSYYFDRDGFYGYGDDFERFAFFTKASIEFLTIIDFQPDVIHFNDWQTGLGPIYLRDMYVKYLFFAKMKALYTIHNIQYQGTFGREVLDMVDLNDGYFMSDKLEFHGNVNYMKAGITYAHAISTVSETYANEIQTYSYGYGMDGVLRSRSDDLYGIVNGIDVESYNPEFDNKIFTQYTKESIGGKTENKLMLQRMLNLPERPDVPMFSIVSRLVDQKGLDLITMIADELLSKDVQFVVLGTGDGRYEHLLRHLANRYPQKVSANITFNEELAQRIYAGSDLFLMPSVFEPCGLGQIIAMKYGTIPVVRKTGGLSDTVSHYSDENKQGNGFVFEDYVASGLMWAINSALSVYYDKEKWSEIVNNAMSSDFSWGVSAGKYIDLYEKLKNS